MFKLHLLLLVFFLGCAKTGILNFKEFHYAAFPKRVVWIQVPGFLEEHISFQKVINVNNLAKNSFEEANCMGKMWNYNLFKLRPTAFEGSLAQLVGKKNISNTCIDTKQTPIWKFLQKSGYKAAILEQVFDKKDSLLKLQECPLEANEQNFLHNTIFWSMSDPKSSQSLKFHRQESQNYEDNQVYFDKSCQNGHCFSDINSNAIYTFKDFARKNPFYVYIIRDFGLSESIKGKKVDQIREKILELDKLFHFFIEKAKEDKELLILLSSTAGMNLEFPTDGKDWINFETKGENLLFKNSSLLNPVFSFGARAENFCGLFEEAELMPRILFNSRKDMPENVN
ncbi:MAG: hypothetical protein U0T83_09475 [Bacteriovoracaceae bacterium]